MSIRSITGTALLTLLALTAGQAFAAPNVLVLQDRDPCGDTSTQEVLDSWGIEYRVSATVPTATRLQNYHTIIVSSHQSSSFYTALAAKMPRITNWLKGGARTLEFHASSGCAEVDYTLTLPRGVVPVMNNWGADYVDVRLRNNPLAAGLPSRLNSYEGTIWVVDHSFAPAVGRLIMVDPEAQPTLIDYCVGDSGRVIATGMPIERFYSDAAPGGVLLTNMLHASIYTPGCQNLPAM